MFTASHTNIGRWRHIHYLTANSLYSQCFELAVCVWWYYIHLNWIYCLNLKVLYVVHKWYHIQCVSLLSFSNYMIAIVILRPWIWKHCIENHNKTYCKHKSGYIAHSQLWTGQFDLFLMFYIYIRFWDQFSI